MTGEVAMGNGGTRFYEPADIAHRGVQAALARGAESGYVNRLAGRVEVRVEDRHPADPTPPADAVAGRHGRVRSSRRRRGSAASRAALWLLPLLLVTAPFVVAVRHRAWRRRWCCT